VDPVAEDGSREGKEIRKKRKEKRWDLHFGGGVEGLQEWRLGGEIWRGVQNRGPFGGSAEVDFFASSPNFGVETHIEALAEVALIVLVWWMHF
jgi:hypothetical protein